MPCRTRRPSLWSVALIVKACLSRADVLENWNHADEKAHWNHAGAKACLIRVNSHYSHRAVSPRE